MKFDKYEVTIVFTEMTLGTASKQENIYRSWFQDKQRQAMAKQRAVLEAAGEKVDENLEERLLEEEANSMEFSEERGLTGFHRASDGTPILYDYMLRGFFKSALSAYKRAGNNVIAAEKKLRAFKKVVDTQVFVKPRQILLSLLDGTGNELDIFERPLRASTPQGERISIARSEYVPAGTTATFQVWVLGVLTEEHLRLLLDYGQFHGLCQWRSGGFGAFQAEMKKIA